MLAYADHQQDSSTEHRDDVESTIGGPRLILHFLLPALAWLLGFTLVTRPIAVALQLPPIIAFLLAVLLFVIPAELGWLYFAGYRRNHRLSLAGIVLYRQPLSMRAYAVFVPLVFCCMIAGLILGSWGDEWLYRTFFVSWWPDYLRYEESPAGASLALQRTILVLSLLFVGILAPVVEELYFRGYVLPRQTCSARHAPVINAALFAAYHILTPWFFVSRTIGMTIVASFTQWKRNIYVAIMVHVAVNSLFIVSALIATFAS